jgi:hypothetical protein
LIVAFIPVAFYLDTKFPLRMGLLGDGGANIIFQNIFGFDYLATGVIFERYVESSHMHLYSCATKRGGDDNE